MTVTISSIRQAAETIRGHAVETPLLEVPALNERVGSRVLLKAENLQRTGSFKFRGALNCLKSAGTERLANGVVAWSSGNHAQGVAAAAGLLGVAATIVMPADAPRSKVAGTRRYGADIVFYDRYNEDREAIGRALAEERGALLVPSYDDPAVIAGQGTAGLEIVRQARALGAPPDELLVCCGGGGLSSGIGLALRDAFPDLRVTTVEPEGFDDTRRALASGRHERNAESARSVCDALLTPSTGRLTLPLLRSLGARGVAVSDAQALAAVHYAFRELKLVVEPGGAVALAAVLSGAVDLSGRTLIVVLSGGNIDAGMLASALSAND
ncbi:MAG: threonine/serine dehydratase [Pseudomonadota bacterium]